MILTHFPHMHGGINRAEVIRNLISALKPGGWLVIEEHDKYGTFSLMPENLSLPRRFTVTKAVEANGGSLSWARSLPTLLQIAGLMDVEAEIDAPFFRGGSAYARFWGHTFEELRDQIIVQGMVPEDVDMAVAQANDGNLWLSCHAMVAAWGRKPL